MLLSCFVSPKLLLYFSHLVPCLGIQDLLLGVEQGAWSGSRVSSCEFVPVLHAL